MLHTQKHGWRAKRSSAEGALRSGAASRVFACAAQASCAVAQATALAIWTKFGTTALDGLSTAANPTFARRNRAPQLSDILGHRDAKNYGSQWFRCATARREALAVKRRDAIFHALAFLRTLRPTASFRVSIEALSSLRSSQLLSDCSRRVAASTRRIDVGPRVHESEDDLPRVRELRAFVPNARRDARDPPSIRWVVYSR